GCYRLNRANRQTAAKPSRPCAIDGWRPVRRGAAAAGRSQRNHYAFSPNQRNHPKPMQSRNASMQKRSGINSGDETMLFGNRKGQAPANRGRKLPPEPLTADEIAALLKACSARSTTGLRHRALIVLLWRGQLRVSEALGLVPKDLDQQAGTVRVLHG